MIYFATRSNTQSIFSINQLDEMFNRIQNFININKSKSFYAGKFQGKHARHNSNLDGIGMRGQVNASDVINKKETVPKKKKDFLRRLVMLLSRNNAKRGGNANC